MGPLFVVRMIRMSCMEVVSVAEALAIVKPRSKEAMSVFIK